MHDRKKGPKDEAKEQEKLKKAKKFYAILTKLLEMKKDGHKERSLLKEIGTLLMINPDFGTLWNYRREILIAFKKDIENLPVVDSTGDGGQAELENGTSKRDELMRELDSVCNTELKFIENCLKVNHKSYGSWHHRVWMIQFMNNPNLEKEIALCNQCLKLDERNFHCWNYRRFVVKFANIDTMDEVKFTSEKILDNLSNFSAWHYRSSLFRQLHSEGYDQEKLQAMLDEDFTTVKEAIFTDPNDQSPWFYLRWLYEFENSLQTSPQESKRLLGMMLTRVNSEQALFAIQLSHHLIKPPEVNLLINDQKVVLTNWQSLFNNSIWHSTVSWNSWSQGEDQKVKVELVFESELSHLSTSKTFDAVDQSLPCYLFRDQVKRDSKSNSSRLDDYGILLQMESESKWVNYMLARLDSSNDRLASAVDRLIRIDPLRVNYYNDLSMQESANVLKNRLAEEKVKTCHLSLGGLSLHSLCSMSSLIHLRYLDLSNNSLIKLGTTFASLLSLRVLVLDANQIYLIAPNLRLSNLEILSLKNNKISQLNLLKDISSSLKHLCVIGNPLSEGQTLPGVTVYTESTNEKEFTTLVENELESIQQNSSVVAIVNESL